MAEPDGGQPRAPVNIYDPVTAGSPPVSASCSAARASRPIYEPVHVEGGEVDWDDGTLVIGVALHGQPRACPVQALNLREMVNTA